MDAGNALFYAAVCGALAGAAPLLANRVVRICVGGVIGVIAALSLPYIKSIL